VTETRDARVSPQPVPSPGRSSTSLAYCCRALAPDVDGAALDAVPDSAGAGAGGAAQDVRNSAAEIPANAALMMDFV